MNKMDYLTKGAMSVLNGLDGRVTPAVYSAIILARGCAYIYK